MALCFIVLVAYSSAFQAGFVVDNTFILNDPRLHSLTSENVGLILQRSYWWTAETGLYRPLTSLSYLFNYAILGNEADSTGYITVNVILHLANVLLVYAIARRLSKRLGPSFFLAALWSVHPVLTEAVTNIVGRADLLAAFGVLGSLYAYIRSGEQRGSARVLWFAGAIGAATIGMFSKESAGVALGVIALYDVVFRLPQMPLRRFARNWLAFALPLFVLLYQRSVVVPASLGVIPFVDNPIAGADFWAGRLTALSVMGRYLWLTAWPLKLSNDYSYAQIPIATGRPADWAAWIAVALIAVVSLKLWRSRPARTHRSRHTPLGETEAPATGLAFFAAAFAFGTFLPASNLLFPIGTIMAERALYLPSAGLIACAVIALYASRRVVNSSLFVPIVLSVVACALVTRTWTRNLDWRTEATIWASAVHSAPNSFKAHQGLADALYDSDPTRRNLDRVIVESERSVALLDSLPATLKGPTTWSAPYQQAAGHYLELGDRARDSEQRVSAYRRSVALMRRYVAIQEASRANESGRRAGLISIGRPHTRDLIGAYIMLSTAHARLWEVQPALEAAHRAQHLEPFNSVTYRAISVALLAGQRVDEAAVWLLAGFMITGDAELRQAAIDLYRNGGDSKGCALKKESSGSVVLDPTCDIVRSHLCAATSQAIQALKGHHSQLADQLKARGSQSGCW